MRSADNPVRIIARLDVKGPNVVKGIQLEGLRVVGNPNDLARKYYAEGADEILFIDTVASLYGRNNLLDILAEAAQGVFVPMAVGGGLRSLHDISQTLRAGADKVAINTAAVARPQFITEAAHEFGSQCIVLSVHAKRRPANDGWEALVDNGREHTGRDVLEWVAEAQERGAGEILLTSVDRDGTRSGFDIKLISAVVSATRIPVIAASGAGRTDHVHSLLTACSPDAICCGALFHYGLATIGDLKRKLIASAVPVRP